MKPGENDVSDVSYSFQAIVTLCWGLVYLVSKLSKNLAFNSNKLLCDGELALIPLYDVVVIYKWTSSAFTLGTMLFFDLVGQNASDVLSVHLLMVDLAFTSAGYAALVHGFISAQFGRRAITVGYLLGMVCFVYTYGTMAALCGYQSSPLELNCRLTKPANHQSSGFFLIFGLLVIGTSAAVGVYTAHLYAKKVFLGCDEPRQPLLMICVLCLSLVWGSIFVLAATLNLSFRTSLILPQVYGFCEVWILYYFMLADSKSWTLITLEPRSTTSTALAEGLHSLSNSEEYREDQKPQHIRFSQLKISEAELLGTGATARVYRGVFQDKQVAVKCIEMASLAPNEIKQHCYEMLAANQIQHSHVVHFEGFSVSPPYLYLAMELCEVGDLACLLHENAEASAKFPELFAHFRRVRFDSENSCDASTSLLNWETLALKVPVRQQILCGVADAVEFIHERGIIHRDLKSGNVMIALDLSQEMGVSSKLVDWGDAIHVDTSEFGLENQRTVNAIEAGMFKSTDCKGTFLWSAPETLFVPHLRNQAPVYSRSSDVYALGMVMYEVITRRVPDFVTLREKLNPEFQYPRPLDLDNFMLSTELLLSAWHHNPCDRCSAEDMHRAVRRNQRDWEQPMDSTKILKPETSEDGISIPASRIRAASIASSSSSLRSQALSQSRATVALQPMSWQRL